MPHQRLAIHPAPFKRSHLSIPPSPFSPLSPLTPAARPELHVPATSFSTLAPPVLPAPTTPLQWVWTCHACHAAYPLGATRRCLDDGHHFCAGTTIVKRWRHDGPKRRTKRHKACASEFDYLGWKGWGRWKRASLSLETIPAQSRRVAGGTRSEGVGGKKDCWRDCDYPSQCRWGKRVGIHTPSPSPTRTSFSFDGAETDTPIFNTSINLPSLEECFVISPPPDAGLEGSAGALGRALEASAKRRKSLGSVSSTSPMKTEFSQTSSVFDVEMVDAEDKRLALSTVLTVDESCIDPALLALSDVDTSYTSFPSVTVPVVEVKSDERPQTVDKLKSSLSLSNPRPSRRHIELLPVSNAQRKLRRRDTMSVLTLPEPLVKNQEQLVEGFSPPEGMRRWNKSAPNVA